jgi:N-acetylmuramoyl-L-alanine amidase
LRELRTRRRSLFLAALAVAGTAVVVGIFALVTSMLPTGVSATAKLAGAEATLPSSSLTSSDGSATASAEPSTVDSAGVDVEVPILLGKSVKVAEAILSGAGFAAQTRVADPPVTGVTPDTVLEQWPGAGALVEAGSPVVITYQPHSGPVPAADAPVVVIDAGHQKSADLDLEPIGPGSKILKPKVAGGATGVTDSAPEYRRTLEIAVRLRDALIAKGFEVVMVRTTDDVDIPNSKRARIGNKAKADLVVRVHCDTSTDTVKRGISTLFPSGNTWVKPIEARSKAAALALQTALTKATSAPSLGVFGRGDMSGFNYSSRPVVMVLCGFMSNAAEDAKLGQPAYQNRIATGIANGVASYLADR